MSKIIGMAFLPLTVSVATLCLIKDALDAADYWSGKFID